MIAALAAVYAVVIGVSLVYSVVLLGAGFWTLRQEKCRLGDMADASFEQPYINEPRTYYTYFLIPCLDEAIVIGMTTRALAGSPNATVIVIDDGSTDDTAGIAQEAGGESVVVHRRTPPDARVGKGAALNDALHLVRGLVRQRGQDPDKVVVAVMDADGRLSDGAMAAVLPLFDDPTVGGVQLPVRIRNRTAFLTRFQDFHFWSFTAVAQVGRKRTQTVSLGGNGQFSRLSALDDVGEKPWSRSLTEDLDLTVTLALRGWKLTTTPFAAVEQQGVDTVAALLRQRRRWYQGHMMMAARLPDLWGSENLKSLRLLELTAYILTPWISILPWSIFAHLALVGIAANFGSLISMAGDGVGLALTVACWYVVVCGSIALSAVVYHRRSASGGVWKAVLLAHAFPLMNYIAFVSVWSALVRIINTEDTWEKTLRVSEATEKSK